ncbi:MAG: hypothetical protein E7531_05005, partial [Ruminococcaceae bacterium]|nr:hypothetical protein [Oscillospiraceae bacterium]
MKIFKTVVLILLIAINLQTGYYALLYNVIEDVAGIVFRNAKKENPAIQLLKQRLSETENALNNLLRAIEEGIITSTTKQRMIELEQTRDEIKLKLIKEEMKKPTITKEGLVLWLRHIQ